MAVSVYEALIVIGIGLIGLIGSIQLENQLNTIGVVIRLGPAKWTGIISLSLIVCGIIWMGRHLLKRKPTDGTASASPRIVSTRVLILIGLLLTWLAAVPILGFNIWSLVFFPALFHAFGLRPWFKSIAAGIIMAVLFYLIFVLGANLPVPRGVIGL